MFSTQGDHLPASYSSRDRHESARPGTGLGEANACAQADVQPSSPEGAGGRRPVAPPAVNENVPLVDHAAGDPSARVACR